MSGYESFTDLKTALIQIKQFRPILTRVPVTYRDGLSAESVVALEVKDFNVKGSLGAERWGSPTDVGTDERILAWTNGLRSDGGGGYVLTSTMIVDL